MLFPLGTEKTPPTGGFYDLFHRRTAIGWESEGQGDNQSGVLASAVFSKFFSFNMPGAIF